uniref:CREG-like beta-barrel domain-containing protein n=1 Tax=Glossina austeni TaxID=7395 RepID=A0A1A9V8W9_GLOAU
MNRSKRMAKCLKDLTISESSFESNQINNYGLLLPQYGYQSRLITPATYTHQIENETPNQLRLFSKLRLFSNVSHKVAMCHSERPPDLNHAEIARTLVNHAICDAIGTISTNRLVAGYPMVTVISIDDNDSKGVSTGKIHFINDQHLNCENEDPMEPTCARVIISGQVKQSPKYRHKTETWHSSALIDGVYQSIGLKDPKTGKNDQNFDL